MKAFLFVSFVISILLGFEPHSLANDLPSLSVTGSSYVIVPVKNVIAAVSHVTYAPAKPNMMEYYSGSIEIEVEVEGNICSADPGSLGSLSIPDGRKTEIVLVVKDADLGVGPNWCNQYSATSVVKFSLPIFFFPGVQGAVKETLGTISYANFITGENGKKEIAIEANHGELSVRIDDL